MIKGQIVALKKLHNSVNGNPRYSVRIRTHERGLFQDTVEYKTVSDSGFAYAIYDGYINKFAEFELTNHKTPQIKDIKVEL